MNLIEKIIDVVYKIVVYGAIIAAVGGTAYLATKTYQEVKRANDMKEAQLQELYDNQVALFAIMKQGFAFTGAYLGALTEDIQNANRKPSYEYLSSVTTYMFQPVEEIPAVPQGDVVTVYLSKKAVRGYAGTGVVVAERGDYFYILTNKHICNSTTQDKCFVILGEEAVKLEFVKQTESAYDLSLWRTLKSNLPKFRAINGLSIAYPSDSIYSVGMYLGEKYIYTEGTVGGYQMAQDQSGAEVRAVIENMSCTHGCSGSGVFNKDGELVAMNFAGNVLSFFQEETAKILAIDGDVIALFLKEFYE